MNNDQQEKSRNPDSLTSDLGSHPVGTGAGAAAGGVTGAAVGAVGGPIGSGIGAVAGAVAGGLGGKAAADSLESSEKRELSDFIDYTVYDKNNERVGKVTAVWEDHRGEPAFLAVQTGWLGLGKDHVVPAQGAEVNDRDKKIRLPYTADEIKNAPTFDSQSDINDESEEQIILYYEMYGYQREPSEPRETRERESERRATQATLPAEQASPQPVASEQISAGPSQAEVPSEAERNIQLKEEAVRVGKREVETGGVRLRKIIRTEVVSQPVELKHEEIVIERVPTTGGETAEATFTEEEIYIPLRREEPVITKEARVREEVRIGKKAETEQTSVSETVRKEELEIEDQRGTAPGARRTGTPRYEPKERSKP